MAAHSTFVKSVMGIKVKLLKLTLLAFVNTLRMGSLPGCISSKASELLSHLEDQEKVPFNSADTKLIISSRAKMLLDTVYTNFH